MGSSRSLKQARVNKDYFPSGDDTTNGAVNASGRVRTITSQNPLLVYHDRKELIRYVVRVGMLRTLAGK